MKGKVLFQRNLKIHAVAGMKNGYPGILLGLLGHDTNFLSFAKIIIDKAHNAKIYTILLDFLMNFK